MSKHNSFAKKFKKQFLSINDSIESYFNKLKFFIANIKKTKLTENNRLFLTIGGLVILTLSYFLIPTYYNKDLIQSEIKNQIKKRYNIELKFNEKIKYGLLPKPHFSAKNLSILSENEEIAISKDFKIFISISKFFSLNKIEIKDFIFNKTDFNIYDRHYIFFKKLLQTEPNENSIIIRNSNIFFKNKDDEVLFINKIYNSKFYYDQMNLENTLNSKNEIFNVPFKFVIKNNKFKKEIYSKFNSKKIRLNIQNDILYDNENQKEGLLDILFVNKNTSVKYKLKKNSLDFFSDDSKNPYSGTILFKPFYLSAIFDYEGLSTKNILDDESIIAYLIKSEVFKSKNLNANIELKVKDITNIDELNNLNMNIGIEEGEIIFSNSNIMWKDDLKINFSETLLNYDLDKFEINLIGRVDLDFKNLQNFYRYFQIKKNLRKKIDKIQIDFVYNINQKKISFDNVKLDDNSFPIIDKYIENFNNSDNRIFNKITFKNFVNNFFEAYAG
tara:strand:- start:480 stop:1979 length:1500 start_codon:yes stop_codon:yes gene_type:complete